MEKIVFSNSPLTFWGIAPYGVFLVIFLFFVMKNNFINNNGVNLLHMSKKPVKKTKVESQIELLKQQEQAIITELD